MRGNRHTLLSTLTALALMFPAVAQAQLAGTDTIPGESCAGFPAGATRTTADADQDGAEVVLICDGANWLAMSGEGSTPAGNSGEIQFNSGGTFGASGNLFWDIANGRLGIGTAVPGASLQVKGDTGLRVDSETSGGFASQFRMVDTISEGGSARDDLLIESLGAILLKLDLGANGISGSPKGFGIFDDSNATVFSVLESGNVGVGTATPQSALDVAGGVKVANDAAACTAAKDGTVRYTGGSPPWEYCNGSAWVNFKQPRCQDDDTGECYLDATRSNDDPEFVATNIKTSVNILGVTGTMNEAAPDCTNDSTVTCTLDATRNNDDPQFATANIADGVNILGVTGTNGGCTPEEACPNVGDVCSGLGSGGGNPIFAGCICYFELIIGVYGKCKPIYVTQSNQSTASNWKTATGTDDIANDSVESGGSNDSQVADSTTFPAFKLCKDLTDGGYTDWYLPARTELDLLWRNRALIGGFTTQNYWSSTEASTSNAWYQSFSGGAQSTIGKTNFLDVRCVRGVLGGDPIPVE